MSRHLFGWSLPPGAANHPNAPWNQEEFPCDVCGLFSDECICPECPVCQCYGDPGCYAPDGASPELHHRWTSPEGHHGLTRSFAQVVLRARLDQELDDYTKADDKYYAQICNGEDI